MGTDPERHKRAEATHELAAQLHEEAADFWAERGDSEHATDERRKAQLEREGAQTERDRYADETGCLLVAADPPLAPLPTLACCRLAVPGGCLPIEQGVHP